MKGGHFDDRTINLGLLDSSNLIFKLAILSLLYHHYQQQNMSKHNPDLISCRKLPGISIGHLCERCDGRCPVCDSYVRPHTVVRTCDECSFGTFGGRCIVCGAPGVSDAYYCAECVMLEKDRDGCPKIINLGASRTDLFYEHKNKRMRG